VGIIILVQIFESPHSKDLEEQKGQKFDSILVNFRLWP